MLWLRNVLVSAVGVGTCLVCVGTAGAQVAGARPAIDPQQLADRVQAEVAELRGLPFKEHVQAENQSVAAFGEFLDDELERSIPPAIAEHYGEIVRKLGLYRGPADLDLRTLMKAVMTSQVAAYYDPDKKAFFVLVQGMAEAGMGAVYSHELYHGLQDQYFDLDAYMLDKQRERSLDDDELLARQAVVEGEATYVMALWEFKHTLGSVPARPVMKEVVRLQANVDAATLRKALELPSAAALLGGEFANALAAIDDIPDFILDTMMSAYLKGMSFVFEVHGGGWSEVEKLYREAPPASTEQILHPEKWFAREYPVKIAWPTFTANPLFARWELLEQNVLGEFQMGIVFREHGLGADGAATAGWDGDRYAVLKRRDSDQLLLLWYTTWDTEADALEFAQSYRRLLTVKYADGADPTRVSQNGRDVLIVEGGDEASADAFLRFVKSANKTRAGNRPAR